MTTPAIPRGTIYVPHPMQDWGVDSTPLSLEQVVQALVVQTGLTYTPPSTTPAKFGLTAK